jgi:hypothetical protein
LNLFFILTFNKQRIAYIYQNIKSTPASMRYQLAGFIATVNCMATVTVLNGLMEPNPANLQRRGCLAVGL